MPVTGSAEIWTAQQILRVVLLCLTWYFLSAAGNVVVKTLLSDFPYPMTVSIVQLLSVVVCLPTLLRCWNVPTPDVTRTPWSYYFRMLFPLAFGKFVTSVSAHVSLWKVPVSYSHTVKASMPLFTVVLSRFLMHESQTTMVYLSLVPIISGVVIATVTELAFDMVGFVSALCATVGFSLMNIYTKKALKETDIHHLRMLLILSRVTLLLFFPLWLVYDAPAIVTSSSQMSAEALVWAASLLIVDGLCMFAQNMIAFTMIALVTPLSYAIANATKRIVVIGMSLVILKNPITLTNGFGMLLAIAGVLMYNKAKYDQTRAKMREHILPFVRSEPDLSRHNLHLSPLHRTDTELDTVNHFTLVPSSSSGLSRHVPNGVHQLKTVDDSFYV